MVTTNLYLPERTYLLSSVIKLCGGIVGYHVGGWFRVITDKLIINNNLAKHSFRECFSGFILVKRLVYKDFVKAEYDKIGGEYGGKMMPGRVRNLRVLNFWKGS